MSSVTGPFQGLGLAANKKLFFEFIEGNNYVVYNLIPEKFRIIGLTLERVEA